MKKKYIIGILVLVLIGLLAVLVLRDKEEQVVEITSEKPEKRTVTETITANGKIQPEKEVKISADVSGEVIELLVKEGQVVKKGQMLLKINPKIYLSQIERMKASLNASKSRLSQAEAQFLDKENQLKRQKKLWQENAISDYEYEQIETASKVAKAGFESAKFSVLSSEASLKEAQENLSKTTIYSPIEGTISKLNVEQGERVVGTIQMAGTEILRIANLNRMEVKVNVSENDIVRVKPNDTAYIEVDAYLDRKFKGIVTEVANSANANIGASAEQITNFEVKILMLQSSYADLLDTVAGIRYPFRPGMSAGVDIMTQTESETLTLPIEAVTVKPDSTNADELREVVFVNENGTAKLRYVQTGIQDRKYIVVTEGIDKDDKVVVAPYSTINKTLEDGMLVTETESPEVVLSEDS